MLAQSLRDKLCVLEASLNNLKMPPDTRRYLSREIKILIQSAEIIREQIEILKEGVTE